MWKNKITTNNPHTLNTLGKMTGRKKSWNYNGHYYQNYNSGIGRLCVDN